MPKVLIAHKLFPQAIDVFKKKCVRADVKTELPPEEIIKIIGEYDGLAVHSATKATLH